MAERNLAGDVLQRLASPAARHITAKDIALLHREGPLEIDVKLHATQPRGLGKKPFRRKTRVLVALARKIPLRPLERSFDCPNVFRHRETTPSHIAPACGKTNKKGPSLRLARCRGATRTLSVREPASSCKRKAEALHGVTFLVARQDSETKQLRRACGRGRPPEAR